MVTNFCWQILIKIFRLGKGIELIQSVQIDTERKRSSVEDAGKRNLVKPIGQNLSVPVSHTRNRSFLGLTRSDQVNSDHQVVDWHSRLRIDQIPQWYLRHGHPDDPTVSISSKIQIILLSSRIKLNSLRVIPSKEID